MTQFTPFEKIPRLNREVIVTEKIDGTNGQVFIFAANEIGPEGLSPSDPDAVFQDTYGLAFKDGYGIAAGSRSRYLTIGKGDNFGFAGWVRANADELFKLGPGKHYGEWWGLGIQRGYGLTERRFSLFNVHRWAEDRPSCCGVVPTLARGPLWASTLTALDTLRRDGSVAAPGYTNPEGIIVYHTAALQLFKVTLENDESPKGAK